MSARFIRVVEDLNGNMFGDQARTGVVEVSGSALLTDLVAAWETSGLTDAHTGGHTLTNNNTVTFVSGLVGNTGHFVAASTQYLSLAHHADFAFGDEDFTIELWTKQNSAVTSVLMSKWGVGEAGYKVIYNSSVNAYTFVINNNSTVICYGSSYPAGTGTWRHIVAWYNSTADSINIRSMDAATDTASVAKTADGGDPIRIGATSYPTYEDYADAEIGPVRIWNRLLSSAEITWLYNSGAGRSYPFVGSP